MAYQSKSTIQIKGLKTRTTSQEEMTNLGKIAPLWDVFENDILPQLDENCELFCACEYRNENSSNELDIVLGARVEDMEKNPIDTYHFLVTKTIEGGEFLSFAAMGDRSSAVLRAWQQARQYFNEDGCQYVRAYKGDYVHYFGPTMATVYISVFKKSSE